MTHKQKFATSPNFQPVLRRYAFLVGVLVALALPSTTALAEGPTRTPNLAPPFTLASGLACSFPLHGEYVINQEIVKSFPPEPNGDVKQIITGRLVLVLTNVNTSKSLTTNVSGPEFVVLHTDGSARLDFGGVSGPIVFFPTDIPPGPKAFISSGRVVVDVTPTGQFILVSQSGHEEDVCAALQ
jgi:hypothetical protein